MGFEPTTSSLGSWHSTTELRPRFHSEFYRSPPVTQGKITGAKASGALRPRWMTHPEPRRFALFHRVHVERMPAVRSLELDHLVRLPVGEAEVVRDDPRSLGQLLLGNGLQLLHELVQHVEDYHGPRVQVLHLERIALADFDELGQLALRARLVRLLL